MGGGGASSSYGVSLPPPPPPFLQNSIGGPPKILPRHAPGGPEVTRTQNSVKNENEIFGISASREFIKAIICRGFGDKKKDHFQCSKKVSAPEFIITD